MTFKLSSIVNSQKVFITLSSDIDGRIDPSYYIPELVELDNKIKEKTPYRLRDFRVFRASGSTPNKKNKKFYSDKENGVPFVRVQNLSTNGELDLSDVIYISNEAHHGLLKRSQVKEFDLLIKITGVGRMAVASVAPEGFEGNINQHIVIVRTQNREVSENLAAFLNLDFVEKLASKRATGGTRPALDYTALFSMPMVNNRDVYSRIKKALIYKNERESEANKILKSIDEYLLKKLNLSEVIKISDEKFQKIFVTKSSELEGRIDPFYYLDKFKKIELLINNSDFDTVKLGKLFYINRGGSPRPIHNYITTDDNGLNWIKIGDTKNVTKYISKTKEKIIPEGAKFSRKVIEGDFLLSNSMSYGRPYIMKTSGYIHDGWLLFRPRYVNLNKDFIHALLSSKLINMLFSKATIGGVVENLNIDLVKKIVIPLPNEEIQNEIAMHIQIIYEKYEKLIYEMNKLLIQEQHEIKKIILGDK